ncbi:MLO-like protein 4 [Impatiens glandulifera]|uniref:MLO-like protein 4 n=1 Tax=Impatiens glandulifera TaxID=253017 RepID=UPI001FB09196|nr:MLO-like protein 4 [Impatiens glandulifera]XP_047333723.1 MLO-like protein 4 [Impatiens glandulifera]
MESNVIRQGRSLEETPTWSVASVTTVMVFVCLLVERSIYRFGKWLKQTRRKALFASLEKIKEELMLLGLISLFLGQSATWISEICVNSSLFRSQFYQCSEEDYSINENIFMERTSTFLNESDIPPEGLGYSPSHGCGEGREPFVSYEGLEQLHRFLFVLGITHVLYSCIVVGLSMTKIYSWRKWENQASLALDANLQARVNKVMRRQSTFVLHHASHPWSKSRILNWMLCFLRQFKSSIKKSDYLALRRGFITKHQLHISYNFHRYMVRSMEDEFYVMVGISWPLWGYVIVCIFVNIHGLNIYFWLSFIPVVLVMLVGTKLQHVVSLLALGIKEPSGTQIKPRDDLFWFGKPEILLRLIQFISFQNAFEMATFIWSIWGFPQRACFMKNHAMIIVRLVSGVIVQFWCSYSTVPLNVLVTQMGSKCKKAVIAESVRESLHSWCKRVKERSRLLHSITTRSTCSLDYTVDERDHDHDEIITVGSGTLSRSSSTGNGVVDDKNLTENHQQQLQLEFLETTEPTPHSSLDVLQSDETSNMNVEDDNKVPHTHIDFFK